MDNNTTTTKTLATPPFSFYFVLMFFVSLFGLALDFIYRNVILTKELSFMGVLVNGIFMLLFLYGVSLVLAGVLWLLEKAITWVVLQLATMETGKETSQLRDLSGYSGVTAIFISFMLLVYINALYFKFHLMSRKPLGTTIIHKDMWITLAAILVIAVPVFILKRKDLFNYGTLSQYTRHAIKPIRNLGLACLLIGIILFGIGAVTGRKTPAPRAANGKPNIIFITLDSLTTKHMSLYGYERPTTPNLEKLAKESYVFNHMHCNTNNTGVALLSFQGRYPRNPGGTTKHSFTTVLKDNGYPTRSMAAVSYFNDDLYRDINHHTSIRTFEKTPAAKFLFTGSNRKNFTWLSQLLSENPRFYNLFYLIDLRSMDVKYGDPYPIGRYFDYVVDQLKYEKQPAFVWAHIFEPHFPYLVPPEYTDYFGNLKYTYDWTILIGNLNRNFLVDRYDTSIRYADYNLGKFIERLKQEGLYDNSILIISADHGESFGDLADGYSGIGLFSHGGSYLNDQITSIPLIVHLPGQKEGKRVQAFAEQVDIAPTLCQLLNIPKADWMEGESLVPYMENPDRLSAKMKITIPAPYLFRKPREAAPGRGQEVENFVGFLGSYKVGWVQMYDLSHPLQGKMKPDTSNFIFVYDLATDPGQTRNLINKPEVRRMLDAMYSSPLLKAYRGEE